MAEAAERPPQFGRLVEVDPYAGTHRVSGVGASIAADRICSSQVPAPWSVDRSVVLKAENLYKRHFFKTPDPFVVVTVDGEQTSTSAVIKKTVSPFWNFTVAV